MSLSQKEAVGIKLFVQQLQGRVWPVCAGCALSHLASRAQGSVNPCGESQGLERWSWENRLGCVLRLFAWDKQLGAGIAKLGLTYQRISLL